MGNETSRKNAEMVVDGIEGTASVISRALKKGNQDDDSRKDIKERAIREKFIFALIGLLLLGMIILFIYFSNNHTEVSSDTVPNTLDLLLLLRQEEISRARENQELLSFYFQLICGVVGIFLVAIIVLSFAYYIYRRAINEPKSVTVRSYTINGIRKETISSRNKKKVRNISDC